jgi:hypothetical protein
MHILYKITPQVYLLIFTVSLSRGDRRDDRISDGDSERLRHGESTMTTLQTEAGHAPYIARLCAQADVVRVNYCLSIYAQIR